jgi:hypothetical protein
LKVDKPGAAVCAWHCGSCRLRSGLVGHGAGDVAESHSEKWLKKNPHSQREAENGTTTLEVLLAELGNFPSFPRQPDLRNAAGFFMRALEKRLPRAGQKRKAAASAQKETRSAEASRGANHG